MEHCENSSYKRHLKAFVLKYPTADKNAEFAIIDMDTKDWAVDILHPENNTAMCYQVCSITEDIKRSEKGIGVIDLRSFVVPGFGPE